MITLQGVNHRTIENPLLDKNLQTTPGLSISVSRPSDLSALIVLRRFNISTQQKSISTVTSLKNSLINQRLMRNPSFRMVLSFKKDQNLFAHLV